jgi:hypothetical protein
MGPASYTVVLGPIRRFLFVNVPWVYVQFTAVCLAMNKVRRDSQRPTYAGHHIQRLVDAEVLV